MIYYFLCLVAVIHVSHTTTKQGEKTSKILNEALLQTELTEAQKIDFIFLMIQIQTRNLKLQNIFFSIDWNVLLTVSI